MSTDGKSEWSILHKGKIFDEVFYIDDCRSILYTMEIEMYDYKNIHSDYICSECGGLIYVESKTGKEICIRDNKCSNFPKGLSFSSITPEKELGLFTELKQVFEQLLLEIASNCNRNSITKFLYSKRKRLIDSLFDSGKMPSIPDLITLNEFLLILNNVKVIGNITDNTYFESIYKRLKKALEQLNFIEDVQNFRYLISVQPEMSAYLYVVSGIGTLKPGK